MTSRATFYERVDNALKDRALGAAMSRATTTLMAGRRRGFDGFTHADEVRDHARAIRAHTVARLGDYLRQFETAVTARGGHVHWAETAEQAVAIVAGIARQHGCRSAVKSKSMVSEEIELNDALAKAGVDVLETDLGEFIVQIDRDHPSHIVAPIIHKSKEQVAESFRTKLGAAPDDLKDVPSMTAFARRTLRAGFLKADMGISGGNFGVAETGSLCIVTNEGNGRLTTTLPRVHVALMGIERLVPTLADLGVMLQILGRSAMGQKLTVYTNIISGRGRSIRSPLRRTVPAVGSDRPAMMCSNVDFPQPDGPIRATNSPSPTEKLMFWNAVRPCEMKRFSRPSIKRVSVIVYRRTFGGKSHRFRSAQILCHWECVGQARSPDKHGIAAARPTPPQ